MPFTPSCALSKRALKVKRPHRIKSMNPTFLVILVQRTRGVKRVAVGGSAIPWHIIAKCAMAAFEIVRRTAMT